MANHSVLYQDCFIIMQINNPQMERMWADVYKPIVDKIEYYDSKLNGTIKLTPRRLPTHGDGTITFKQIVNYLKGSRIIIADLTNERPNCYFEAGYVMGLGEERTKGLILCCQDDHNPYNLKYLRRVSWFSRLFGLHFHKRPFVHFDVINFDFAWWDPDNLEPFKEELKDKITQRLKKTENTAPNMEQGATTILLSNINPHNTRGDTKQ